MKRLLSLLAVAGAVAGAVWYTRQQDGAVPAPAEGEWTARPKLKAVPDSPVAAAPGAAEDDLTAIKGIGPKYSEQLASLGVTSFTQLATADPATLKASFDARASVEDWIAQAKERAGG
ncbi:MAG: helix-hairpin-helix domain-containing protein [Acidimicrobiia bacterium]|nr:helix-hairpin-helix domain-containing protein [Acidimicrobiia bacterium]